MNVQNVKMVINFFSWSSQKYFEGTIFLNIDSKVTIWHEEAKKEPSSSSFEDFLKWLHEEQLECR